jgi:hypothetical protein
MSSVAHPLPEQGQLASARSRHWVVNDVRPSTLPLPAFNTRQFREMGLLPSIERLLKRPQAGQVVQPAN